MSNIIQLKEANCKDCYKCIRNCPVKAIRFTNNQARIIPEECILCGQCVVVCPQDAKTVRSDVDVVKSAIRAGKKVVASVAPSFIADLDAGSIEDLRETLKKLGFADAQETAIGAELVTKEYEKMIASGKHSVIISSCCPSVNTLIQKYHPAVLPYLAPVLTPMQAHCKLIKEQDPDAYCVFIGPCFAKKEEAENSKYTDVALTFDELRRWLSDENVAPVRTERPAEEGKRARFYPRTGGILKSMDAVEGWSRLAIDGVENCINAFNELEQGRLKNVFIEVSACQGSCTNGPSIRDHHAKQLFGTVAVDGYAGEGMFGAELKGGMTENFKSAPLRRVLPGEESIRQVMVQMGKTTPDQELNCGCCGYPTCREKAIAVCQGKAEIGMCLHFLKEKAESFSDKIIGNTPNAIFVLNEDLEVQQINNSALKLFKLRGPDDILHAPIVRLIDPSDYLNVALSGRSVFGKRKYIAEYKIYVEETIVYDRQYRILICILRDVTDLEKGREQEMELRKQTVEITDKVIEKQMRIVQEIASLLGETTAETKIALTKLKDAMINE